MKNMFYLIALVVSNFAPQANVFQRNVFQRTIAVIRFCSANPENKGYKLFINLCNAGIRMFFRLSYAVRYVFLVRRWIVNRPRRIR